MEKKERIYDMWARRNPNFECRFENSILREISDYGVGSSALTEAKGKVLGAGYEPYIMAFFIGLYCNKRKELTPDIKTLGQPLQYWGNLDSKKHRRAYPRIREYIFAALIARTEIDFIALDKGEISAREVVSSLIKTMEEYANYGFYAIEEKLKMDKSYFFKSTSFLDMILASISSQTEKHEEPQEDVEADALD